MELDDKDRAAVVSLIGVGLFGRCPRCGEGKLFDGFLALRTECGNCKLDYGFADTADGPAVLIMLIVGFIVVGGALAVEITYQPSYWVHDLLWLPLTLLLSLILLRPVKALLFAQQFRHKAEEGRLGAD